MPSETEAGFQAAVLELAQLLGWRSYHTHDSRRSHAGFPDLVMVREGQLIFAELKSARGRVTREQQVWIAELARVAAEAGDVVVQVHLWRPADWPAIVAVLKKR